MNKPDQNVDDITDELIKEALEYPLSDTWPPVLIDNERVLFKGQFSRAAWIRCNVSVVLAILGFLMIGLFYSEADLTQRTAIYITALTFVGIAITYLIYRSQEWVITDRAVYITHSRPVDLRAVLKLGGFGATVRFGTRFGMGTNLLGVENASDIRATLTGRKNP
ncbi:hypothetical protein GCM10007939_21940 [Amylibacter marinus]|uniref:PH domain-containing protein n=1 Tax=Amylibacter marinus TaxID=1475483 RepID=A0ABQ5VX26_9RHOB|nr:hypothetical protein [Amylibacter marinus]GLQ35910.1 hypothetical protein GCM10007939_21940 [Amylibacter marinus]